MADESSPLELNPRFGGSSPYKTCVRCGWEAFPPGVIDGRAPCPVCGAISCGGGSSPCRGCALQARLRAVCAGVTELVPPGDGEGAAKVHYIVRSLGDYRDVLIASDRVVVRTFGDSRYHSYYPQSGPAVLGWILCDTGIARLEQPQVALAVYRSRWRVIDHGATDELAWLIPHERGVEIRYRPIPARGAPPAPRAIPSDGPWALPPPWSPPPPVMVTVLDANGAGVACPHCGEHRPTYRALDNAFLCVACGRSFTNKDLARRERTPG